MAGGGSLFAAGDNLGFEIIGARNLTHGLVFALFAFTNSHTLIGLWILRTSFEVTDVIFTTRDGELVNVIVVGGFLILDLIFTFFAYRFYKNAQ